MQVGYERDRSSRHDGCEVDVERRYRLANRGQKRSTAPERFRSGAVLGYQLHLPVADKTAAIAASPPAEMTGTSFAEISFHFDIPTPFLATMPERPAPPNRPTQA
jgi:hypothetical protein